jgi:signal transduction histidine kinase
VHRGDNLLEIEAAGRTSVSLSAVSIGPRAVLERRRALRLIGAVIGPGVAAVAVGSLALCVLLLWARSGDSMYGYFGYGALAWALHNAWSVSPVSPLDGIHRQVWWTSLYTFFVAMLVIFCVRLAGWNWPRFDRALCGLALAGPLLLYAASGAGVLDPAQEAWLLGWIGVVAVGLSAVAHYAWRQRNANGVLLMLTGAVSLAFAVHDWVINHAGQDNNPVYLVPYAGLLFVLTVSWTLIDRFVGASLALESMNSELERRVDLKSTQLVRTMEQMRAAKDSAEAANRAKTTFLAAASHDLRQPIHALGLYMATLADERLDTDQRTVVQRMKGSLAALATMFNALLDVSRMDAGAVIPRPRPFQLAPMLHRLAEEFAAQAAEKGLRLSVRIAPAPASLHALGDPMLIERILRNLLGNAVRYTLSGGVLLSCRLRGGPLGHWCVEVWDTGPGIAEADREHIFEEFYQVGNPERDRAGGLGLGLSIVRRLTELLGLPLQLTSVPGRGSRFVLHLACTRDALPQFASRSPDSSLQALAVAVVDDDPEVREGMQVLLERWGCRVYAGADADDVLHLVNGVTLQAIVADYRLRHGRTGADAIRDLRAACGQLLPALIVSGDSSPERLALMQASGLECMSKPVLPVRLRSWLQTAAAAWAATALVSAVAPATLDEGVR